MNSNRFFYQIPTTSICFFAHSRDFLLSLSHRIQMVVPSEPFRSTQRQLNLYVDSSVLRPVGSTCYLLLPDSDTLETDTVGWFHRFS
jgi:hypothetical protein